MRAYALCELCDQEAIDLFVRREDALKALPDAVWDQPEWQATLYVAPIELGKRETSTN